jgi:hypothetical protein
VRMRMAAKVVVSVTMNVAVRMGVVVGVLALLIGAAHSPGKIDKTKSDQRPGRPVAPHAFKSLEVSHLLTKPNARNAQQDRTQRMTYATTGRDDRRLLQAPGARLCQGDERQIMVRTQQRMNEGDRDRSRH